MLSFPYQISINFYFLQLGRATVHNPKTGKLETADYRVSKR